jgi:polysaccharide biosynthesis transport protein
LTQVTSQIDSLTNKINTLQANNPSNPTLPQLKQQLNSAEERHSSLEAANNQLTLQDITSSNNTRIFQLATPPTSPDHPKPSTNALIGAVLGLLLALCVVLLREFLDDRVRTAEQLENLIGVATIGTISPRDKGSLLLSVKDNLRLLDSFGIIRTNLSFMSHDRPLRSIVVTSPAPYEGKSTTAINLAISLAWSGKRVLLMDADLRRPTIHKRLGIQNVGGLSLILLHGKQHDTIATVPGIENLYVLTAGPKPPNPTELLESKRMHQLLQTIQDSTQLDVVVIDTPPALAFADVAILATQVDGVILNLDAQRTREGSLIETMEAFKKINARIVGIILIGVKQIKANSYMNNV